MSITNKALIVVLRISQWTGRKLDKTATGTVEATYATEKHVGNYTKKLLPGCAELDRITCLAQAMRQFFYEQTLPWCTDGSRILAAQNYMEFTKQYRTKKNEFETAVASFLQEYPVLKEAARSKLGSLFREEEYPTVERLEDAFACDVAFLPVPDVNDFRVEILDSEKEAFLKQMREVEATATRECWTRLYDVVHKAAVKLKDPNAIFRDSLIENIAETCALLPRLNVTDSPELEAMRKNVEALVAGMLPDAVRHDERSRSTAAQALADATAKMSVFMGARS